MQTRYYPCENANSERPGLTDGRVDPVLFFVNALSFAYHLIPASSNICCASLSPNLAAVLKSRIALALSFR